MGQGWKGAPPIGLGGRGQERAPGAPSCGSLPSPAALLSFCTSAANVPLTYIFFQTYVTFFFFFPLCGRRQARIQKKREEAGAACRRKQGGIQQGSRKQRTQTRAHQQPGEPAATAATSAGLRDRVGWERDHAPRRGPERCPGSSRLINPCPSSAPGKKPQRGDRLPIPARSALGPHRGMLPGAALGAQQPFSDVPESFVQLEESASTSPVPSHYLLRPLRTSDGPPTRFQGPAFIFSELKTNPLQRRPDPQRLIWACNSAPSIRSKGSHRPPFSPL